MNSIRKSEFVNPLVVRVNGNSEFSLNGNTHEGFDELESYLKSLILPQEMAVRKFCDDKYELLGYTWYELVHEYLEKDYESIVEQIASIYADFIWNSCFAGGKMDFDRFFDISAEWVSGGYGVSKSTKKSIPVWKAKADAIAKRCPNGYHKDENGNCVDANFHTPEEIKARQNYEKKRDKLSDKNDKTQAKFDQELKECKTQVTEEVKHLPEIQDKILSVIPAGKERQRYYTILNKLTNALIDTDKEKVKAEYRNFISLLKESGKYDSISPSDLKLLKQSFVKILNLRIRVDKLETEKKQHRLKSNIKSNNLYSKYSHKRDKLRQKRIRAKKMQKSADYDEVELDFVQEFRGHEIYQNEDGEYCLVDDNDVILECSEDIETIKDYIEGISMDYLNESTKKSKIEYDYDGIYAIPRTDADSIYHVVGMNVSPSFASLTDDELGIFDSNFEPTIITSFDSFDEARQWIDQNQDRTKRVVGITESKRNDMGYGFANMIWTVKSTKKSYTPNYQDFRSMVKSIKNTGNHNNVFKE